MAKKREPKKRMIFISCILISLSYIVYMIYQFVTGVVSGHYGAIGDFVAYQEHPVIFYVVLALQGILPIGIFFVGYATWWDAKRKDRRDEWLRQKKQEKVE